MKNKRDDNETQALFYDDKCDKYDYLISVGCGAIAGLVDVFFVGSPMDSKLMHWTDAQVDKCVIGFARMCGWNPSERQAQNVKSAIGFLEHGGKNRYNNVQFNGFRVNYDQQHSSRVNHLFSMSTKNHHFKSLAHSPDLIGLFFSILNQFTSTASFVSDGRLITIKTESFDAQGTFECCPFLLGHNLIAKLFCGVVNWLGHIMSDIAGSSGAVGRGSGLAIPFYELFQFCDFGSFQVGQNRNTLAKVATKVFQEGYDIRFGLTMSIPVVLSELSIKFLWAIKHYFYHKKPLAECVPSKRHNDLRVMLILGNGTLCLMDGADAALRSGGNWVLFFSRLNIIAWFRLVWLVFREVCIRAGISFPLQKQLDGYIRINEALNAYLARLKELDVEAFKKATEQYERMIRRMDLANDAVELNELLKDEFRLQEIPLPWQGDFDKFMQDRNNRLVFQ